MNRLNKTTLLGLILIVVGTITVFSNFGAIPWYVRHYIFQWENILILIGLFLLISDENRKVGGILVAIGLVLVIDDWFRVDVSIWDLWPVALIFLGLYIISRRNVSTDDFDTNSSEDTDYIFGGSKIRVPKEWNVELRVTSIFGGLSDKRAIKDYDSGVEEKLYIKGLILFGGAEITN